MIVTQINHDASFNLHKTQNPVMTRINYQGPVGTESGQAQCWNQTDALLNRSVRVNAKHVQVK